MTIRTYRDEDRTQVLDLLRLNTPQAFDPSEEQHFVQYLDHQRQDYFVLEADDQIVGAGGVDYFPVQQTAHMVWGMIHPDFHGQGLGTALLRHRLAQAQRHSDTKTIIVKTSQMATGFYKRMGFQLETIEKDHWAPGFDLYLMHRTCY